MHCERPYSHNSLPATLRSADLEQWEAQADGSFIKLEREPEPALKKMRGGIEHLGLNPNDSCSSPEPHGTAGFPAGADDVRGEGADVWDGEHDEDDEEGDEGDEDALNEEGEREADEGGGFDSAAFVREGQARTASSNVEAAQPQRAAS